MSTNFKRTDRIAEMMQRKLAQIIQQEIHDPRFQRFRFRKILAMQKFILQYLMVIPLKRNRY